jgi:hypothetical protein
VWLCSGDCYEEGKWGVGGGGRTLSMSLSCWMRSAFVRGLKLESASGAFV